MRVHRGLLGWGILCIVAGAVPLAVRGGLVDAGVVADAWQLWPLILIGIGVGLVLRRTRVALAGGLIVAVTAGLMAGGVLTAGITGFGGFTGFRPCSFGPDDGLPFPDQRGRFAGDARVELNLDCGQATVTTGEGDGWTLGGRTQDGAPPLIEATDANLAIRSTRAGGFRIGAGGGAGAAWDLALGRATTTRLGLTVNAGSADVDLAGMTLTTVDASVNAGSVRVDLSNAASVGRLSVDVNAGSASVTLPASSLTGSLSTNAGALQVCVPGGVDVRIALRDNSLGSNNFDEAGLEQHGETWETPGFGTGAAAIELTASANLGSIALNPEGGCG